MTPARGEPAGPGGVAPAAQVAVLPARGPTRQVALLLPGGRPYSYQPGGRLRITYLRMGPFALHLQRAADRAGLAVWSLRYRYRGWNGQLAHPLADTRWALDEIRRRHGDVPVTLVGHSMGGRAAVRAAGHPLVAHVVALAPWLPEGEPTEQLVGRTLLVGHPTRETIVDPESSYEYAARARAVTTVCRFEAADDGHAMLRRAGDWHALVTRYVTGVGGIRPLHPLFAAARAEPRPGGLRVPLPASWGPAPAATPATPAGTPACPAGSG